MLYNGHPAISKIACLEWNIGRIERETWAYLQIDQCREGEASALAPAFLAHLIENGRVMGLLLEKLEGDFASIDDLSMCENASSQITAYWPGSWGCKPVQFHTGSVKETCLAHTEPYEESKALAELQSLPTELVETTGRGASVTF